MLEVTSMAPKKYNVKVIQKDIDKGLKLSPYYCPISLATRREVGCSVAVSFEGCTIWLKQDIGFKSVVCALPPEALEFMWKFDNSEGVEPFSFDLELKEY